MTADALDFYKHCRDCGTKVIRARHDGPPLFWTDLDPEPVPPATITDPADAWWPTSRGWTFGANNRANYLYRPHRCPAQTATGDSK